MNRIQEVSLLIGLALLLVVPVAAYEENIREDIFLVRPDNEHLVETTVPTYLENEDLTFFACLERDNTPIRLSVLCKDTNEFADVQAKKWGSQNCYIGSTNLEQFDCTSAVVQAEYTADGENLKLSQDIRINKFSDTLNRIIQSQFEDGGWETPLDTAYGLFALSHFPDIFPERIDKAIEYLKLNRDEQQKCWPADDCRISTTANILFLLDKIGYEELRVQHDGHLYLEKTQNYLTGEDWRVEVTDHKLNKNNTLNTSCVYDYDGNVSTFSLEKYPRTKDITITPVYSKTVNVVCTENVYVDLYNQYDEHLIGYQGDNFSHTIPEACWTRNNEHIKCDLRSTLYGANTPIDGAQRSASKNYLSSLAVEDRTAGQHLTEDWNILNDALYLHLEPSQKNAFITNLLYQQNNTGGWHINETHYEHTYFEVSGSEYARLQAEIDDEVSQDIVATGYAVMALLENDYTRSDEPIIDAERWVSLVEDQTSMNHTDEDLTTDEAVQAYEENRSKILNDTKRNAMAFYVLQHNARPLLLAKPRVVVMNQDSVDVDIINPTIFELDELDYEFSQSIRDELSVEAKDYVGAYSFRRVTISRTTEQPVNDIGYLRLSKGENEYLKLPVILQSAPKLNLSLPEKLTVFGNNAIFPFSVKKTDHPFQCSLEWTSEGISSNADFDVNDARNGTYDFPVEFAVLETESEVYEGEVTCTASKVTFKIPFATNVVRFSSRPLQVKPEAISITGPEQAPQINVKNLLDQRIDIEVGLSQQDPYVVLSNDFLTLFPGESRNVSVEVVPPEGENYTTSNSVTFTTFNVEERVLLTTEILPQQAGGLGMAWWIAIIAGAVAVLGAGGYYGYTRREELAAWYEERFHKESVRERIYKQVQETEQEEERVAIRNMIRILKLQGLKDTEVRQRLREDGYTDEDIDRALSASEESEETPQEGGEESQAS